MPLPYPLNSLVSPSPAAPGASGLPGAPTSPSPMGLPAPGGGAPGGDAGGGGNILSTISDVLSKRLTQSSGADPDYITNQLRQVKSLVSSLIPHTALRYEGVARHLTQIFNSIDRAIKETETAKVQQAAQSAIEFSPAMGTGGGGPGMVSNAAF